jgi:hypothetical protein
MSQSNQPESGGLWSSRRFVVAAIVVGIVLAMGVGVVLSNLLDRDDRAGSPPPAETTATPGASASTGGSAFPPSICGLDPVELSGSVTTPPEAEWSLVGTTAAPASQTVGPGIVESDSYRRCFAHTPEGAVVAAANLLALGATPAVFEKVVLHSVAAGPGQQALAAQGPAADGGVRIQTVGFRLLGYDGATATVDIALRTSRGALAGQVYDLVWEGGDWKMRVSDDGSLLTPVAQIPDLSGYIPWAGA